MKISEIRRVIESCNWSRNDLGGATREEFRKMDVRTRLTRHIEAVEALVIAPRFAADIADAADAIIRARATIERWEAVQLRPYQQAAVDAIRNGPPTLPVSYSGRA